MPGVAPSAGLCALPGAERGTGRWHRKRTGEHSPCHPGTRACSVHTRPRMVTHRGCVPGRLSRKQGCPSTKSRAHRVSSGSVAPRREGSEVAKFFIKTGCANMQWLVLLFECITKYLNTFSVLICKTVDRDG